MFLFLMLIALCASLSAQSRIEVIGADTMATVPIQHLRIANAKILDLKQCNEEITSLFSQTCNYASLVNNLRSSVTELKETNRINEVLLSDKQKIIDLTDKQLKKAARKAKLLKLERNTAAAVTLALLVKMVFFR